MLYTRCIVTVTYVVSITYLARVLTGPVLGSLKVTDLYKLKPDICFLQILINAITVSLLHRERPDWFHSLSVKGPVTELLRHGDQNMNNVGRTTHFEKVKSIK